MKKKDDDIGYEFSKKINGFIEKSHLLNEKIKETRPLLNELEETCKDIDAMINQ